jgi:hypothetical protein
MEDELYCLKINFITKYWMDLNQILNAISGGLIQITKGLSTLLEKGPTLTIYDTFMEDDLKGNFELKLRQTYQKKIRREKFE